MKETKKKEKSGNNRMNKKVAVVVLILAVYFGYQLANIYVPEKFEGKAFYKFIYVIIRIAAIIARFFESIGLGNEAYNIRLLSSFHAPMPKQDESVLAKNILIEGIEVRTYTPIVEDVNPLWPVMIFYHGGGFFMGEINAYDYYLFEFVKRLNMTILSVRYRLAPENPFPTPIDDCYKVTQHIINNHEKFHADLSRLVVAGDSAGGTIVSALTQRLARENGTTQPKIQVLVYPLVQFANAKLPAYVRYAPTGVTGSSRIGIEKYSKWYFGIINQTDLIISIYDRNEHFALIEDENEYNRIVSYLNVDRIDHKYKAHANYYENRVKTYPRKLPENSELRDNPQLVEFFKQLFKPEVSPLFAPESDLKNLPKAYFILLEWDFLKDEGLLYASRLKEAGVDVHIAFYENAYHGIASSIEVRDFVVARTMQDDLIRYLTQFL